MSVIITIKGTPIEFPSSGESPNWAPAIIEFSQLVQDSLSTIVGPYDVPETKFNLASDSIPSFIDIEGLDFPSSVVRSAYIKYTVYRQKEGSNPVVVQTEAGSILVNFNETSWYLSRDFVGDSDCDFSITSSGQVQFKSNAMANDGAFSGFIKFSAQTLSNED